MFILFNPNPRGNFVGDCVIRAICKLTNRSWEDVYMSIAIQGSGTSQNHKGFAQRQTQCE